MFAISPETFGRLMTRYYISNDAGNVELYKVLRLCVLSCNLRAD